MSLWPVSIKGVVLRDGHVVLLRNEREEWELPGGKLDPGESPTECVRREFAEELGLSVVAHAILDSWVYDVLPDVSVLVITYGCLERVRADIRLSMDHPEFRWFALSELDGLPMPEGYRQSIRAWGENPRSPDGSVV